MPLNHRLIAVLVSTIALTACADDAVSPTIDAGKLGRVAAPNAATENAILDVMDAVNAQLAAAGANYQVAIAEYVTAPDAGEAGSTIVARNVGNKQLTADFVPMDPRREDWSGPATGPTDDITFAIDQTIDATPILGGLTAAQATAAILRGIGSWDAINCSVLPLTQNPDFGLDIGLVAFQNGLGGSPFAFADVQHAGFRDINFAGNVLGVTFTFVFLTSQGGPPTDIDGNGLADVALREIYFDPSFPWRDTGVNNIDLESVAVHEFGHGLSQGHFGNIFIRNDGLPDASPRAVMNAAYISPFRTLTGTDNGGHCGIWDFWPAN